MSNDTLTESVAARGGFGSDGDAERAIEIVLGVVGQRLGHHEAERLAEALPASWADVLCRARFNRAFDLAELYARVAVRELVPYGIAVEHTAVVCSALASALSDDELSRLQRQLSPEISVLFVRPELHLSAPERPIAGRGHTLADGRPGSRRPLSESPPPAGQNDSVVWADNPHGDTKLSSASGLTQEREDESLATGRPTSSRPVSEGR